MTTMNLYIRKHTFSETCSSEYFFNFFSLLEKDIPQSTVDKLILFFEKSNKLREEVKEYIHPSLGNSMIVFSDQAKDYGFTSIGFVNHTDYKNIFLNLPSRAESLQAFDSLYQELGWTVSPTKVATISGLTFNNETQKYEGINFTFDQIESLYNSATIVDD
jgi:hypothetical protein